MDGHHGVACFGGVFCKTPLLNLDPHWGDSSCVDSQEINTLRSSMNRLEKDLEKLNQ